ncbi:acyl transferase domain-containing protein [Streptomyces sp. CZ24]|nr:acyltransferase domain-containing protein [Streptomyces sp. CZ24]MDH6193379.1 acyl transferase domain-containing protein [Streptomyces sp. CZ24]
MTEGEYMTSTASIETAPAPVPTSAPPTTGPAPERRLLLPVAADTEEHLRATVHDLAERLRTGALDPATLPAVHGSGRHRTVAVADGPADTEGLRKNLLARLETRPLPTTGKLPALAFLFSGGGPQWMGLGRALTAEPTFRATLEECDRAVHRVTGWSVIDKLLADDGETLPAAEVIQPLLFSVQTALARTLQAWGLRSDLILGASIGEAAAVVAAGVLSLEEGARLIATWSALVQERASGHGALTVCDMPLADAEQLSADSGGRVFVASHLAPTQVCISGTPDGVAEAERELATRGIRTLPTTVDYAGHSPLLTDLGPELIRRLGTLPTRDPHIAYWSTVTHGFIEGAALDAPYWVRNMCEPTLLEEGIRHLTAQQPLRLVEVTPHPVAMYSVQQTLNAHNATDTQILMASHRDQPPRQGLEDLVANLWCEGYDVNWAAVRAK